MKLDLREIFAIIGTISAIIFILSLVPALMQYSQGNYTGATDIVIDVTVDETISTIYWAVIITFVGSVLAIFGIKLRT